MLMHVAGSKGFDRMWGGYRDVFWTAEKVKAVPTTRLRALGVWAYFSANWRPT